MCRVPDVKTIWLLREYLVEARAIEKLFALFDARLEASGYMAQGGQIIDATVIRRARLKSMIHFRKPKGKPMDRRHSHANAARSKVRSAIKHVFAAQESRMSLFVRTVGIKRADENRHATAPDRAVAIPSTPKKHGSRCPAVSRYSSTSGGQISRRSPNPLDPRSSRHAYSTSSFGGALFRTMLAQNTADPSLR